MWNRISIAWISITFLVPWEIHISKYRNIKNMNLSSQPSFRIFLNKFCVISLFSRKLPLFFFLIFFVRLFIGFLLTFTHVEFWMWNHRTFSTNVIPNTNTSTFAMLKIKCRHAHELSSNKHILLTFRESFFFYSKRRSSILDRISHSEKKWELLQNH